jgi:hypothetical protein
MSILIIRFFLHIPNGTYSYYTLSKTSLRLRQHIVTCIARQRTGKHLATEYTHSTIELRMLLLVARQQSARQSVSKVTIT